MDLDSYFDFLTPDDIRIRGTRIGVESVLYEHIHRARTPEEIAERFPTLTLDQVYATILYYLRNQESLDAYLADWLRFGRDVREEQNRNPAPAVARLKRLKAERASAGSGV